MGLIQAAKDSISSVVSDQWREYFYCDSLSPDVLMVKGEKRVTNGRNSNTKGTDNIISNGSVIAVNEGQCMIIVDQGGIVDVCAEAGEFIYDNSTEPSLFYGNLGENVKNTFTTMARRFTFGGNTAKDQRVYFFNTKEIMNNMYGTATPIPFHIVDKNTGLSIETTVKCNGMYTFKLVDPLLFYKNVCANVKDSYNKSEIVSMLKSEMVLALQPALAVIGGQGVLPSQLIAHTKDITELLKQELSSQWTEYRGIEMVSMTLFPSFPDGAVEKINKWAETNMLSREDMRMARKTEAFSNMMENMSAGSGDGGGDMGGSAMNGMMGMMAMNMMNNMMGNSNAFGGGMVQGQQSAQSQLTQQQAVSGTPILGWTCSCGCTDNRGKFCTECGKPKPAEAGWTCGCGTVNQGKFCMNCGSKKPAGAPLYKCDKCGWEPEDPANPPKFCPECGDIFDDNDVINK